MSVAATPPIGNPYPQCTSGIAYDARTIPGSVATLATCIRAMSTGSLGSSDLDANTIPGTRIVPSWPIRNRYGVSSVIFMR